MSRGKDIKVVVVGDGCVGKTCLLLSYSTNSFPGEYIPTVFDNYSTQLLHDGHIIRLALWDTAGQSDYDRLRPLSYPQTDVFLVCYSVDNKASFRNLTAKWLPEVQHHCPTAPIVIVGCKSDLRTGEKGQAGHAGEPFVTLQEGKKFAETAGKKWNQAVRSKLGCAHVECSAMNQVGLNDVFHEAITIALAKQDEKPASNGFCTIV